MADMQLLRIKTIDDDNDDQKKNLLSKLLDISKQIVNIFMALCKYIVNNSK